MTSITDFEKASYLVLLVMRIINEKTQT